MIWELMQCVGRGGLDDVDFFPIQTEFVQPISSEEAWTIALNYC